MLKLIGRSNLKLHSVAQSELFQMVCLTFSAQFCHFPKAIYRLFFSKFRRFTQLAITSVKESPISLIVLLFQTLEPSSLEQPLLSG